jgi:putative ABC transport system permease protein
MFKLALRNLSRNLRRLRPMILVLGFSFFVLFVANSILSFIEGSFSGSYVNNLTGQASVSAQADENFTLFGADTLLVGEYLVPPVIDEYGMVSDLISDAGHISDSTSLVISAAQMTVAENTSGRMLFGVDFDDYREFFPGLELIAGGFPSAGQPGIVIQKQLYDELVRSGMLPDDLLGSPALLTTAYESTFTIREVPVSGVFRYPLTDELLSRVVLVDADTARALNGFVYGAAGSADLGEDEQGLLDASLDDLFGLGDAAAIGEEPAGNALDSTGDEGDLFGDLFAIADSMDAAETDGSENEENPIGLLDSIDSLFSADGSEVEATAEQARATVSNAWNFILLRFDDNLSLASGISVTEGFLDDDERYLVRDWRRTIGGTVLLVWFIRIVINAGIIFVIVGASAVTINAIVLSVLERAKEIGTMRSIGATRMMVSVLFAFEIIILILSAALVGIAMGIIAIAVLNSADIVVSNQYLNLLFGGQPLTGLVTAPLVLFHVGSAALLALLALMYPLKKILGLTPLKAMQ